MMTTNNAICFDIETGPLPESQLRDLYEEPTFDKFAATCDQRWKPETVKAKFEESKAGGWQKFADRAALSPMTGQVLAIGICSGSEKPYLYGPSPYDILENCEKDLLCEFWDLAADATDRSGKMIGHNIYGFDLPFLMRRSWVHGIAVPEWIMVNRRYWAAIFVDLMDVWACGNQMEMVKLNNLARLFGIPGKTGSGADFARLWNGTKEERQQAVDYLIRDVEVTRAVARRLGVME